MTFVRTDGFFGGWGSAPPAPAPAAVDPLTPVTFADLSAADVLTYATVGAATITDPGDNWSAQVTRTGGGTEGIAWALTAEQTAPMIDENGCVRLQLVHEQPTASAIHTFGVGLWDGGADPFPGVASSWLSIAGGNVGTDTLSISGGTLTRVFRVNQGTVAGQSLIAHLDAAVDGVALQSASAVRAGGNGADRSGATWPVLPIPYRMANERTEAARTPAGPLRLIVQAALISGADLTSKIAVAYQPPAARGLGVYSP